MTIRFRRARVHLENFDFKTLFVEELGWARHAGRPFHVEVDSARYRLAPIAQLGGMVVYLCEPPADGDFPAASARKKIDKDVAKLSFEHIVVFVDAGRTKATWLWVKREPGKTTRPREHTYNKDQPGDSLLQKLAGIAFDLSELDAEGQASIAVVSGRVAKAFDVERVTRRFYDRFKEEHAAFLKFVKGMDAADERAWYTSVMLNRLMFIYFIQKKGFLDGDPDYLRNRLEWSKQAGRDRFYRGFLVPLFFEGFAREEQERSPEIRQLLGKIPYLNGGLFLPHKLETAHGVTPTPGPSPISEKRHGGGEIQIPDSVFERLFQFFDGYTWHLDERPLRADDEINPDVLGYIFEKYINQKQMGAYYTKEDITGYICRNTILPFLLDKLGTLRYDAVHSLPLTDVEPYIYPAVKQADYLPTETGREYAARQKRLADLRGLGDPEGLRLTVNDLITYNLDVERFVQDWLRALDDPLTLRAFYFECLTKLTVLDPTVGSGAFLFAAMNILEPLYEICLDKMPHWAGPKYAYADFKAELARIADHPNRRYFIYKSIIVNNLYGVDIMEEATEICKLRLFLKLVAQIDDADHVEPLPDIDFNIRAGNTLVGYASLAEVEQAASRSLFNLNLPQKIREADVAIRAFRELQTRLGISARALAQAKADTQAKLGEIEKELNEALKNEYGARSLEKFVESHRPFHWYVELNQIMQDGGFDVIVGNPPYVAAGEIKKQYSIRGFETENSPDIYANVVERVNYLLSDSGRSGAIVPLSITFSGDFKTLRSLLLRQNRVNWFSSYDNIPAPIFSGVSQRCTIWVGSRNSEDATSAVHVAPMRRWRAEYRPALTANISYTQAVKHAGANMLPKYASDLQADVYAGVASAMSQPMTRYLYPHRSAAFHFGFSPTARNFVSAFEDEPPVLHSETLKRLPISDVGYLPAKDRAVAGALLAIAVGEVFFWYWLTVGDGFHVTNGTLSVFASVLNVIDEGTFALIARLGDLLHQRRFEALVFKKNAGKYVGNFNYRGLFYLTRRSDLLLLAGLGLSRSHAEEVFSYVQRVLSINISAGEKAIPEKVKAKFPLNPIDESQQERLLHEIDRTLARHYGFTDEELDFIINYDIKYRMGKEAE